jgi:hypothetical protein
MKTGTSRALLLVLLSLAGIWLIRNHHEPDATGTVIVSQPEVPRGAMPAIKAAHWFGSGWAVNFWNTKLEARAEKDFAAIRDDGFNTLVLVVPWAGFTASATSTELDPDRMSRLLGLIRLADRMGLQVILRLSYAWDSMDASSGHRLVQLWHDPAVYSAWLDYLGGLWAAVADEPNVLFGFFSWEDLWGVMGFAEASAPDRLSYAGAIGFREWLQRHYTLDEINRRYALGWTQWEQSTIPARREPAFKLFLEFVDEAWIQRFFVPAQARFPKMSMEIRIDSDPVWNGEKLLEWHSHESAWDLPGADWTTIYWSPAMGGKNEGEQLSPAEAAGRLRGKLKLIHERTSARQIFIGQFLAEDFTPGYEKNGKIPREQVAEFLADAGDVLKDLAGGYGLWTWSDYFHDAIPNPEFREGLRGWTTEGEVVATEDGVRMAAGSAIGRTVYTFEYHSPGGPKAADLCVTASATETPRSVLQVEDQANATALGELGFGTESSEQCLHFTVIDTMRLTLTAAQGALVSKVSSHGFLQPSGMREADGQRKPIAEAYQALNQRLTKVPLLSIPLYEDGWMGKSLVQNLSLPAGEQQVLSLRTFRPADWPVHTALTISIDGQLLTNTFCDDNGSIRLPLPTSIRTMRVLRIEAEPTFSPEHDQRQLGCLIKDLVTEVPAATDPSRSHKD